MKKALLVLIGLLAISVGLTAQQLTVAVSPFEARGGFSADEADAITEILISELVTNGTVNVVDRRSFDSIIAEMQFQASDWADSDRVAQLGAALNASSILQGSVSSLGGRVVITVRILDINTVQFVSSSTLQLANMGEIFDKFPPFVLSMLSNLPGVMRVYQVGELGPSGGYVFFDKGSYSDGWRYLEAAPDSAEFSTGFNNAETRAGALNINGNTGWRLPTREELNRMYGTLKQHNLGNFANGSYFSNASSSRNRVYGHSTINMNHVWIQNFESGNQSEIETNDVTFRGESASLGSFRSFRVRAVRQF
ncbi:MAG: FlgO family outer membrane protein [Treponema sp.]|nr:FlgO family outer membrane protein [Treponema sp.]